MKVLFIINSLKYKSGTERVACILANLFDSILGFEVVIVNRDTDKINVAYHLNKNVTVYKIKGNYYKFHIGLNKLIHELCPHNIIIHNMGKLTLFCSFLKNNNARLISLEHVAFKIRPKWVQLLSKFLYKRIEVIVCLTQKDTSSYVEFHSNIVKINNISPFDVQDISNIYDIKSKEIIAIGRLTYQKNFQALLSAWNLIQKNHDQNAWKLLIYGKGEEEAKLKEYISNNSILNVELKGELCDVEEIYKKSSFFVMSSRFEGLPMVLIEAQSFGLPIVSFDCPHGPSEIIKNNINGLLVEDQNVDKLADAITLLIQSDELRSQFSIASKEHANLYSKKNIIKQWENLIK